MDCVLLSLAVPSPSFVDDGRLEPNLINRGRTELIRTLFLSQLHLRVVISLRSFGFTMLNLLAKCFEPRTQGETPNQEAMG